MPVAEDTVTGGDGRLVVSLVLQGGDTGNLAVWIIVLGAVRFNDDDGGYHPFRVSMSDHGEAVYTASQRVMVDTGGQVGAAGSVNVVIRYIHSMMTGNGSTVGVPTTTI